MNKDNLPSRNAILHRPLMSLGNFLEYFVCSQNGPASIKIPQKKTQVGEYVVCNEVLSHRDGILIEDYIGLTSYDIGKRFHYRAPVLEHLMDADNKIFNGEIAYIQYKQSIPIDRGLFAIEKVIKQSILSKDGKVLGLLAYAHDITAYVEPLCLFLEYQRQYPEREAVEHFLCHIGIQSFFYTTPTKKEIEVLFALVRSSVTEYVAKEMNVSAKVIEDCKGRLSDNLKSIALHDLIVQLRMHNTLMI